MQIMLAVDIMGIAIPANQLTLLTTLLHTVMGFFVYSTFFTNFRSYLNEFHQILHSKITDKSQLAHIETVVFVQHPLHYVALQYIKIFVICKKQIFITFTQNMEAVGGEVIAVILPIIVLGGVIAYSYREQIKQGWYRIFGNPNARRDYAPVNDHPAYGEGQCSICLTAPKQYEVSATCGHSFCGKCLMLIYERRNQQIECPLCRRQITTIFKSFPNNQGQAHQRASIETKIHQYNQRFDDNRPLLRRLSQFPHVLRRIAPLFMNPLFLTLFIKSVYFIRSLFFVLMYLVLPYDLIPQRFFGIFGIIDDLVMGFFFIVFAASLFALIFMRRRRH